MPVPPVAEESPVAEEAAPPAPDTQPIRLNTSPDALPPVRGEVAEGDVDLPRLDINLAEAEGTSQLDSLLQNGPSGTGEPTRVQLPQPGDDVQQFSPDDFIVPNGDLPISEPEAFDAAIEGVGGYPDSDLEADMNLGGENLDDSASLDLAPLDEAGYENSISEPGVPPIENELSYSEPSHSQGEEPIVPDGSSEEPPAVLGQGSMGNLLSEQSEAPMESRFQQPSSVSGAHPGPPVVPPEGTPAAPSRSDADVLDEMFGSTPRPPREKPSRSTVILVTLLVALVIIAGGALWFVGSTLGFWGKNNRVVDAEVTPPPSMSMDDETAVGASNIGLTSEGNPAIGASAPTDEIPAMVDPVAQLRDDSPAIERSTTTLPGDTSAPVRIVDSTAQEAPSTIDLEQATAEAAEVVQQAIASEETAGPALSMDERIQSLVNGEEMPSSDNIIPVIGGAPTMDPVESAVDQFNSGATALIEEGAAAGERIFGPAGEEAPATVAASPVEKEAAASRAAENYNPPASFAAPSDLSSSPLGQTHDLLDAFLRAPDLDTRLQYVYQGASLRPAIEEYYRQWPFETYERFSLQLFQMEDDPDLGGPYWVYLVSTSDIDQGFPIIIRVEDGNLKVDWEIYSEFEDEHFVQFQKGGIASPHSFRLVIERVSDYYGPDRDQFPDLDSYYVYQVNPPYGDLNEYAESAFVKQGSPLATELDKVVGLNDEPLAVIVTLEQDSFPHGVKHLVISDYITEGWFR
ncbi:MAG: hypothetical protein AAGC68_00830 [Verrucomicrobiota bacterium]